jgi:hypothetical protein
LLGKNRQRIEFENKNIEQNRPPMPLKIY